MFCLCCFVFGAFARCHFMLLRNSLLLRHPGDFPVHLHHLLTLWPTCWLRFTGCFQINYIITLNGRSINESAHMNNVSRNLLTEIQRREGVSIQLINMTFIPVPKQSPPGFCYYLVHAANPKPPRIPLLHVHSSLCTWRRNAWPERAEGLGGARPALTNPNVIWLWEFRWARDWQ